MKIVLGSSMRHRELVRSTMQALEQLGLEPIFPNLDYAEASGDQATTLEEKRKLTDDHFAAVDRADAVYFLTPDGYMGTSCKLELGYALARRKPVYFSEPTNDWVLDAYATGFIPLDQLEQFRAL